MSAYSMAVVCFHYLYKTLSYKRSGWEVKQQNHIIYHDSLTS